MGQSGGKNVLDQGLDAFVNVATYGTVGYEGNGQFGKGLYVNATDETLGEITGRNVQREALQMQQSALTEQKAKDAQSRADALKQQELADVAASNAAGNDSSNRRLRALMAQQNSMTATGTLGAGSESYLGM